ncbi:MAG: hypothetical protein KXJ61_01055 [Hydrogenophaga sp.]|jgi:hypothetical protein|uniref:hypothetical protein n=1 Tax=Hydrogenophaga sp. TaxID=1904254 RepID=UPI001D44A201|nr:hypothetical protein [Hydrogenophaga sp.]MBW0168792.1 hypothetical protein [Hydrogenophaga sp.]MBW0185312.1 hypothetical protein [Hydrogenophaga sp.]
MCSAQHFSADESPLQLLVVCPRGERLETVRELTRSWVRSAQILWTADPGDALRRAREEPLVLAIVDARLDRASGHALSRSLAQHRADIDVLRFDESATLASPSQPSTWLWAELPRAIRWWVQRHQQPSPAIVYQ